MTLKNNITQREQDKFVETSGGSTAVRVLGANMLIQEEFDYVGVAYPTTTSEVYTYKTGGSGGTTVATVTVVYTTTTKSFISSVAKS